MLTNIDKRGMGVGWIFSRGDYQGIFPNFL